MARALHWILGIIRPCYLVCNNNTAILLQDARL